MARLWWSQSRCCGCLVRIVPDVTRFVKTYRDRLRQPATVGIRKPSKPQPVMVGQRFGSVCCCVCPFFRLSAGFGLSLVWSYRTACQSRFDCDLYSKPVLWFVQQSSFVRVSAGRNRIRCAVCSCDVQRQDSAGRAYGNIVAYGGIRGFEKHVGKRFEGILLPLRLLLWRNPIMHETHIANICRNMSVLLFTYMC